MMDDALSRLQQIGKEAVLKEQAKMIASEFYSNELLPRDLMILGKELVKIASKDIRDSI
ncbi:hypothetical protein V6S65_09755 [Lactococcus lactis]|jgi:hypothetical protein|uniref:hypothetical protein n=1 Tax=Lactococcus TaxID=1357 RepID=UPI0012BD2A23|nr:MULTISPECIES: hypothetical protein [Lactococcus]MCO0816911.1 hypothetical protein [Lactococcus lactis]MDM7653992.1 hypothetical protein [Lactococcus cremoris]MDN6078473.1 hypothetical protein [Lactococcus lactis]MDN6096038.1 hypothetical protein [Lactococcus lactis]